MTEKPNSLVPQGIANVSDHRSDQEREEGQLGDREGHAVHLGVDERVTFEERVEDGVDEALSYR